MDHDWTPTARDCLELFRGRQDVTAATGHRPKDIGLSYSKADLERLARFAKGALADLNPGVVVVGGAQGWDTAVAFGALWLNIPFLLAVPFRGQESQWPEVAQRRYEYLKERAATVVEVYPPGFSAAKLLGRNKFMTELARSGRVLALYDERKRVGGTAHCVRHARSAGVAVVNVWGRWASG